MAKPNGKNIITILIAVNSMFVGLFGFGIFKFMDQLRLIYSLPERVEAVEKAIVHQDKVNEMHWQFGRNMTDDTDRKTYYLTHGSGIDDHVHEVDVRGNNDGHVMAFIYDLWIVYPVKIDPADTTRKEIDFMDPHTGEEDYIPLKEQPR